jgi:two-component system, NarL family, response regulator YdfI
MISVLIFCVDAKLRCTLGRLAQQDRGIMVVGIADDHRSFVELADRYDPNVVLAQGMPNDEPFARWQVHYSAAAWVLIVDPKSERACFEALSSGASAILPLSTNLPEIIATIRLVAGGLAVFPQKLLAKLSDNPGILDGRSNETAGGSAGLSKRERAVLLAMADGLSNKEIARRLAISFHTVKFHVASILEKLEVDTRTEAVIKAAQLGLVMI